MGASLPDRVLRLAAAGVGAVRLGIPVETVVQAIPVPASAALLPRRQGALCGVVVHDGVLVPVVDLARWVEVGSVPAARTGSARILILREAGRTLGLQVDSVDGLVEVAPGAIARLHHDDSLEEVFHSAAQVADSGQVLSLLDVGRLAALAASWHEDDPQTAAAADAGPLAEAGEITRDYALLQLDALRLGIAAADLAEVMPMPALERFGGGIDSAWCLWRGRHLPVLAASALPGLPDAATAPLLAVVEHGELALGLPARAALALQAFVPAGSDAGALTGTVYDADGDAVRLLDTAALFAHFPEARLSMPASGADVGAPRAVQDSGTPNDGAYIVFEAGQLAATPIAAVEQILPLAPGSVDSTMPWQGGALPLVDLRPGATAGAPGHVLIVAGARPAGYVVTRVELLVPAGSGRLYRLGASTGAVEFVTVDTPEGQASYRIVDLAQVAASRIDAVRRVES